MSKTNEIINYSWLNEGNSERPFVIAGPCSAENEEQVLTTASELKKIGITHFRAGVWKPRTKPGGFEGVGRVGLDWLVRVKRELGLKVCTEVANKEHVEAALDAGIDVLWIGARTSANPFSVQEIADALKGNDATVFVKNPVNPDVDLWLGAIQRIERADIKRIGAIHRGFSQYRKTKYRNAPCWQIAMELRRLCPQIPMICDPSHMGGKREFIRPLSQTAIELGYDGLMVEAHCDPDGALSDSKQQVTPEALHGILCDLPKHQREGVVAEELNRLRLAIDNIDDELLSLLAKRLEASKAVGNIKRESGVPFFMPNRYDELLSSRGDIGKKRGMNKDFVVELFQLIHSESVKIQLKS